ncbi:MAG TPA: proline dehydrogenase [Bacilli bacterium]|nr:proline dehydrogenase [Bacilli bacterium]
MLKPFFLFLSENRLLKAGAKKWGHWFGASRFVAGDTLEQAIETVSDLEAKGFVCTLSHLGEFVSMKEEAILAKEICLRALDMISDRNLSCHLSVKLTQLGIDIDWNFAVEQMKAIAWKAQTTNNFVRIDMEDYPHCQLTFNMLELLYEQFPTHIGTVLQAYLHRSEDDLERLKGMNLRLVKGAYRESETVSIQSKEEIDKRFFTFIKRHLKIGGYAAIATHDHHIIAEVQRFCKQENIANEQFEFQMLYGIRPELQQKLVEEGHTVRIYVPFGVDWFSYFMRRVAERPHHLALIFQGMIK